METRVIEFSLGGRSSSFWRTWAANMCAKNPGLTVDPKYGCNNAGVCYGLRFTGPKWMLDRIERKYGYGGGSLPACLS